MLEEYDTDKNGPIHPWWEQILKSNKKWNELINGKNEAALPCLASLTLSQLRSSFYRQNQNIRWGKIDGTPPLQPKPPGRFVHMRYCFGAHVNRTWTTKGIFKFILLSCKNWYFCDFNIRAMNLFHCLDKVSLAKYLRLIWLTLTVVTNVLTNVMTNVILYTCSKLCGRKVFTEIYNLVFTNFESGKRKTQFCDVILI